MLFLLIQIYYSYTPILKLLLDLLNTPLVETTLQLWFDSTITPLQQPDSRVATTQGLNTLTVNTNSTDRLTALLNICYDIGVVKRQRLMTEVTQVTIQLAGQDVEGYKLPDGSWVLSQNQLATVLGESRQTVSNQTRSKWLKEASSEALTVSKFTHPLVGEIKGLNPEATSLIIAYFAGKGNQVAQQLVFALVQQALVLRLEAQLNPEAELGHTVAEVLAEYPDTKQVREQQHKERVQSYFQDWMLARGLSPAMTHNYLTQCVLGRTAEESRQLPLYAGGNQEVGLDHTQEYEGHKLDKITQVKWYCVNHFRRNRPGWTFQDYIETAIIALAS